MNPRWSLPLAMVIGPMLFGLSTSSADAAYEIKRGDSLSKIAVDQYGNLDKWKALYELNKELIKDPHWIYPGQRLRLLSDDQITLDRSTFVASAGMKKKSQEWRLLPRQSWEKFTFITDPYIDPTGFDKRSTVGKRFSENSIANLTIAPDRIPVIGEITGSRSNYEMIGLGEQVFMRSDESLQVGMTYSVTSGPEKLSSSRDGRVGFAYALLGRVKVIGVRDGLFIGTVISLSLPIKRGNLLIPEVAPLTFPKVIACPTPLTASIMVPSAQEKDLIGQLQQVFLDVGTKDGVQPGMIFRHYLHRDPYTHDKLSSRDFMIESELQVLSSQAQFSTAIVVHSRSGIHADDEVVGLADLKDYDRNMGLQSVLQEHSKEIEMDALDRLDQGDGIGEKENEELRQLENWSKHAPSEGTGGIEDEIKKESTRPGGPKPFEVGSEPAPNDQSAEPLKPTPATAPESTKPADSESKVEPKAETKPEPSPAATPSPEPTQETSPSPEPTSSASPEPSSHTSSSQSPVQSPTPSPSDPSSNSSGPATPAGSPAPDPAFMEVPPSPK
jgi:hypothetical protein